MPYAKVTTIGALALAIASATGCSREAPLAEDTSINEAAEREADRVAELQRERDEAIAKLNERVSNLERDYSNEEAAARPRGTSGGSARNVREELKEDVTNAREAVDDLRTTTAENWWERHERALKQSADDIEEDVRAFAGARTLPAARGERAADAPSAVGGDPAPFTSKRDAFVTALRSRVDAMEAALSGVKARGARETELEDLRARIGKLGSDIDDLRTANAEDWWNITKERVTEYIDRVEGSIARLDDLPRR